MPALALVRRARPPRPAVARDARPVGGAGSEVMLHQTQVPPSPRVYDASSPGSRPRAMAEAGPGAVIAAWGRLGYPRRARRLWEAAVSIDAHGWPDDLTALPGVGRYTAGAVAAQADDADVPAVEVNMRRVVERVRGARLPERAAERAMLDIGRPLRGRDGCSRSWTSARCCAGRASPRCAECPLRRRCATRGPLAGERRSQPAPFAGSFRATARAGDGDAAQPVPPGRRARRGGAGVAGRPTASRWSTARWRACPERPSDAGPGEEVRRAASWPGLGEDRLGVELHALDRELAVAQPHHQAVLRLGADLEHVGHGVARRPRASGTGWR